MASYLDKLLGVGEATGTLTSGLAASIPAGVAGIEELLNSVVRNRAKGMGAFDAAGEDAASRVNQVRDALTYSPRSDAGRKQLQDTGASVKAVGDAAMKVPGVRSAVEGWEDYTTNAPLSAAILAGVADVAGPGKAKPSTRVLSQSPRAVAAREGIKPTVAAPERIMLPDIYKRPDDIAKAAALRFEPEHPSLPALFDTTRSDLASLANRKGNIEDPFSLIEKYPANPKGAAWADKVTTPQNAQRLIDVTSELQKQSPGLYTGMKGWYPLDPLYQRALQLTGGDQKEALRLFNQLNNFGGIESPNLAVPNEWRRASAAHNMAETGKFDDWIKYGGLKAADRGADFPPELAGVPGRVGHVRAAESQRKFREEGAHGMESPKAPLYIGASGVPESGFQTSMPVLDAHVVRSTGLPDVRTAGESLTPAKARQARMESASTPELTSIGPWFRDKVAEPLGLESVPAQAIQWSAFGPLTGVDTALGPPKLEILSKRIWEQAGGDAAKAAKLRDDVIMGRKNLGFSKTGALGAAAALAAGGTALSKYLRGTGEEKKEEKKVNPPPPQHPRDALIDKKLREMEGSE